VERREVYKMTDVNVLTGEDLGAEEGFVWWVIV
jgi:hypothetical protein